MTLAEALLRQISEYSARSLPKFTWQSFYFVYFCLAKHLSKIAGTQLTQGRTYSSSRPDRYFIFITPVINSCLWQHAYKREGFKQLKLKPSVTPEGFQYQLKIAIPVENLKILRSKLALFS